MASLGTDPLPPTHSSITNNSQRPSAHTQRYDRQLRLWASSGQSSLERSRILVVGASALSAQILKNLVLPGIGSFVLLDDAIVNDADLGVNFFLQPGESEGKYAAEEMCRLLAEMNSSVTCSAKLQVGSKHKYDGIDLSFTDRLSSSPFTHDRTRPRCFKRTLDSFPASHSSSRSISQGRSIYPYPRRCGPCSRHHRKCLSSECAAQGCLPRCKSA